MINKFLAGMAAARVDFQLPPKIITPRNGYFMRPLSGHRRRHPLLYLHFTGPRVLYISRALEKSPSFPCPEFVYIYIYIYRFKGKHTVSGGSRSPPPAWSELWEARATGYRREIFIIIILCIILIAFLKLIYMSFRQYIIL